MALPDNALQTVQTYQRSGLAFLQNLNCFISTANTKFKDFEKMTANLGDTVGFDLPPRYTTTASLTAAFQGSTQRVQTLTAGSPISTSYAFNSQQLIFNVHDYMEQFGKAAIREIGANIEADVASTCVSGPYRFYGDGVTPINSYNQLAAAVALFHEFGASPGECKGYLSNLSVAAIVAQGLNQFVPSRNDKIAMSWEVGMFDNTKWYRSNLLPIHTAGSEGQAGSTLTVVSFTQNSDGGVTSITFSGCSAASDASSVKQYDKFQFNDGVSTYTNLRFRTFVGHKVCQSPVQFAATADAASTAGSQVTVSITPALQWASGATQNINAPIVAGMQVSVLPTHRAGMITSGNPLFLAMPRLPDQPPFLTGNEIDPDTGVSIRQTYGTLFGQNTQGFVHDAIYGYTLVPEYSMSLIFPV